MKRLFRKELLSLAMGGMLLICGGRLSSANTMQSTSNIKNSNNVMNRNAKITGDKASNQSHQSNLPNNPGDNNGWGWGWGHHHPWRPGNDNHDSNLNEAGEVGASTDNSESNSMDNSSTIDNNQASNESTGEDAIDHSDNNVVDGTVIQSTNLQQEETNSQMQVAPTTTDDSSANISNNASNNSAVTPTDDRANNLAYAPKQPSAKKVETNINKTKAPITDDNQDTAYKFSDNDGQLQWSVPLSKERLTGAGAVKTVSNNNNQSFSVEQNLINRDKNDYNSSINNDDKLINNKGETLEQPNDDSSFASHPVIKSTKNKKAQKNGVVVVSPDHSYLYTDSDENNNLGVLIPVIVAGSIAISIIAIAAIIDPFKYLMK